MWPVYMTYSSMSLTGRRIETLMEAVGFTVTDSRQVKGMIYTVTGKKA